MYLLDIFVLIRKFAKESTQYRDELIQYSMLDALGGILQATDNKNSNKSAFYVNRGINILEHNHRKRFKEIGGQMSNGPSIVIHLKK